MMPDTCNPEEASHIKIYPLQDAKMSEVDLPRSSVSSEDWQRETWPSKWLLDIFGIQSEYLTFVSYLSPSQGTDASFAENAGRPG